MKISNIEIRAAAVAVAVILPERFAPLCCDTCEDEEGRYELEIVTSAAHLHIAAGASCAEKYLRALAVL